jgi:hypothetical protein
MRVFIYSAENENQQQQDENGGIRLTMEAETLFDL